MTEKDIYQKILENSDIYEDYKAERKKYLKSKDTDEKFNFVFHYSPSEWILQAFEFSTTSNRIDYWRDINSEWSKFVKGEDTSFIGKHTKYSNEKVGFALQAVDYKYGIGYNIPKTDEEYENVLKHCSFYEKLMKRYDECFVSFSKISRYYWVDRITNADNAYWSKINNAWKAFHNATVNDDPDHILHPYYAIRDYYNPEYDYSNDIVENDEYEIVEEDKITLKSKDDFIEIITHCNFFPELAKKIEDCKRNPWREELKNENVNGWISGLFIWDDTDKWNTIDTAWVSFYYNRTTNGLDALYDFYNPEHDYSKDFKGLGSKEVKSEYKIPKTKDDFIEIIKHCSFFPELNAEFIKVNKTISLCYYLKKISTCLFIDRPILWERTAKGHDYWKDIDKKWNKFCGSAESHDAKCEDAFAFIKEYYDPDHDYSKDTKDIEIKELKDDRIPANPDDYIKVLKHCYFYPLLISEFHKQKHDLSLETYLNHIYTFDYIQCVDWKKTSQGIEFWYGIDTKWKSFCGCIVKHDAKYEDVFAFIKEYYDPDHDYSKDTDALGTAMEKEFSEKVKNPDTEPSKDFKVTTRKPKLNKLNFKL